MKGATAYEYEWFGFHVCFLRPYCWFWPRRRQITQAWEFPNLIRVRKIV